MNDESVVKHISNMASATKLVENRYENLEMINMIMTRRCNFACTYCPEDKEMKNIVDWSVESFSSLIDFCATDSLRPIVLTFFGGEPLLKWKLMKEMLDGCAEQMMSYPRYSDEFTKFRINISTNAYLLTDDKLAWLADWMERTGLQVEFLLSVDTFEENTSRILKSDGSSGIEVIKENITNLSVNYPQMMRISCFRISLVPDLAKYLYNDVVKMIKYRPLNIIIHPVTTDDPDEFIWSQEMWDQLAVDVNAICDVALMTSNVEIECMEGVVDKGGNCGAGSGMLGADSSGYLYSCYFTAHSGDIDDRVANYITGEHYRPGLEYIDIENNDPECQTCEETYCHQCHVKNLLHKDVKFCSAAWCHELAGLYEATLEKCDLTAANRWFSGPDGLDMKTFHEHIQCHINSIAGFMQATIEGRDDWEPEEHCGCETTEGSIDEAIQILANLNLLKLTANNMMLGGELEQKHKSKWFKH